MVLTRSMNKDNYEKCIQWDISNKKRQREICKKIKMRSKYKKPVTKQIKIENPKRLNWPEYQLQIHQNMMKIWHKM